MIGENRGGQILYALLSGYFLPGYWNRLTASGLVQQCSSSYNLVTLIATCFSYWVYVLTPVQPGMTRKALYFCVSVVRMKMQLVCFAS